jgi:hypothetical protein
MKKIFMNLVFVMMVTNVFALTFNVDGITYSSKSGSTVEVTSQEGYYKGIVVIPSTVLNAGISYTVTTIGEDAFDNCEDLTSVTIPSSVTTIKMGAFSGCSSLKSMTIPSTVSTIENSVFANCERLLTINVDPDNANYCSQNGILFDKNKKTLMCFPMSNAAETYSLPNTVLEISDFAFAGVFTLTSVTLPSTLKSIGKFAFGSSNLKIITILANTPPTLEDDSFEGTLKGISIYVLNSSLDAYKNASDWKVFPNIKGISADLPTLK